jgi:Carboxypeptidase regulatory-like domain
MAARIGCRCLVTSFILSVLCLPGSAQTAELSGVVRDPSQAVIAGATITAVNVNTGGERTTKSNRLGNYALTFLQPGDYGVRVRAAGFKTVEQSRITLNVASLGRLDFVLQVEGSKEAITVRGDVFARDETSAVGSTIDRRFVANLPLNGRTFQSLIALVPGVVPTLGDGQFSVNGQRDDGNYLTVDGVSANVGISAFRSLEETAGGTVPGFSVLGTTSNLVPVDAMQEFTLQTSSYSAEFGRTPGGQVQILTRSGSNQYHGGLFDYFRNEALDANDWFANAQGLPRAPLRQNDFGGVFGGPIIRDKTFFFLSYEGLRLRQPQFAEINVPSLSARTQAPSPIAQLLNAFPVPNGPGNPLAMIAQFSATYSDPASLNSGSIRLDQVISQKLTLFGRFSDSPSSAESRADSLTHVVSNKVNTRSLTLGATLASTPRLANDFRVNFTRYESSHFNKLDNFGGAVPPPESLLFPAPFASPSSSRFIFFELADGLRFVAGRSSDHAQRQFNLVDGLSILVGSHSLKLGVDYRYLTPIFGPQDYGQQISFRTLSDAVAGKTPIVPIFAFDRIMFSFHNLSLYSLDVWRPISRLTLSYGLRWEFNPPPSAKAGQSLYTLQGVDDLRSARVAPAGTPLYGTTYANFAPRFGAAYQASQRPGRELIVRGGFGTFYDLGTGVIGEAAESFPHFRRTTVTGVPFPLGAAGAPPSFPSLDPPYTGQSFLVFDPKISLPRTYQWNLTLQQSLGAAQTITGAYVGAAGRKLLRRVSMVGSEPNFTNGSMIDLTTNTATSDYHALQLQFQRRLSQGLQTLISYCWSHSIDISSSDVGTQIPSQYVPPEQNRGPSDFDARHSFQAALTYEVPGLHQDLVSALFGHWLFESILVARTETPVDVTVNRFFGVDPVAARPDLVPGAPLYLQDTTVAGGRRINPSAFVVPAEDRQGTLGRNVFRGFPLSQLDLSLGRTFNVMETMSFQIRADAFNVLNHPNFANPSGDLSSASLFGVSTAMANTPFNGITNGLTPLLRAGGPRSLQLSLRFYF